MSAILSQKRQNIEYDESETPDLNEDSSSDSDSLEEEKDFPVWEPRPMNPEEYDRYLRSAIASKGFDVERVPGTVVAGGVAPLTPSLLNKYREQLSNFCKQALEEFNSTEKESPNYEFIEIVKANCQTVAGQMYYITFLTKALSDETCQVFQAKVWEKLFNKGSEVKLCRIKPT